VEADFASDCIFQHHSREEFIIRNCRKLQEADRKRVQTHVRGTGCQVMIYISVFGRVLEAKPKEYVDVIGRRCTSMVFVVGNK
jgi:hypothetical protein